MLLSFGTFWMVLCFWQRIRQCFRTPVIVFMDKLCIAQKDAHLKESGQKMGRWEGVVSKKRRKLTTWNLWYLCKQTTCDICAIIWGKGQENIERKYISLISVWDCGRVPTFQSSNISMSAGERNLGTGQFLEPFRVPNDFMVSALLLQIVVSRPLNGGKRRGTVATLHVVCGKLSGAPLRWQCSYEANKRNTSELCQHLGGNWVIFNPSCLCMFRLSHTVYTNCLFNPSCLILYTVYTIS